MYGINLVGLIYWYDYYNPYCTACIAMKQKCALDIAIIKNTFFKLFISLNGSSKKL